MISSVKKKCSTYFLDNQFCKGYLDPPGGKFRKEALVLQSVDNAKGKVGKSTRVSVQGVESLWGDCRFIPADWGS